MKSTKNQTKNISQELFIEDKKKKAKDFKRKVIFFIKNHNNVALKIFFFYIIFIILGAVLLYLPISLRNGYLTVNYDHEGNITTSNYDFWKAIFTSFSAFTNTGLTIANTAATFTTFGQVIIYLWIQIGGFGLLSIFYLIGKAINKIQHQKIIRSTFLIQAERGGTKISSSGIVLINIFFINIFIQVFFAFILSIIFYSVDFSIPYNQTIGTNNLFLDKGNYYLAVPKMYHNYSSAAWNAFFLTGSSINNAGFDLFGAPSMALFRNDIGVVVQLIVLFLFLFGGIGYIIIYDLWKKIEYLFLKSKIGYKFLKFTKKNTSRLIIKPRLSIFSKICLLMCACLCVSSVAFAFISEYCYLIERPLNSILNSQYNNQYGNAVEFNKNWAIVFNTLSTRSAGFATINCSQLSDATKWTFIILMFLGASPTSTGGGIRTTTLLVLIMSIWTRIRNKKQISIFNKRITHEVMAESAAIFLISISLVIIFSIIMSWISNDKITNFNSMTEFIFEASSAFGTTGLTVGVTLNLNEWSYLFLIILMFVGQLGITNSLEIFQPKNTKYKWYDHPKLEIKVG